MSNSNFDASSKNDSDSSKEKRFPATRGFEIREPDKLGNQAGHSETSPQECIGPYRLIRTLGEGGMGTVWLAEQTEPIRRQVALKTIHSDKQNHRQIIARFEAERQALAMMDHRNIAKVLDAGISEKHGPYFVMEYCKGQHINRFCEKHKLNLRQRLQLFLQVCNGVQHAHQKGIIHRDLKPGNILVVRQDKTAIPKIIDFGLVKAIQPEMRLTDKTIFSQALVGTFKYMSPEQVGPDVSDVDTRADVYALGTILYELLTGSTPIEDDSFRKKALDEIIRAIREDEPPRPSKRLADSNADSGIANSNSQNWKGPLRNELDWVVMCALDKNRERRYETAASFAKDIKHYLAGDAVDARPPSKYYLLRKFVSRNKAIATTVSLVAAVVVVSLIAISWSAWQARQALNAANLQTARAVEAEISQRKAANLALANEEQANAQKRRAIEAEINQRKAAELALANEKQAKALKRRAEKSRELAIWNEYKNSIQEAADALNNSELEKAWRYLMATAIQHRNIEFDFLLAKLGNHWKIKGNFVDINIDATDGAAITTDGEIVRKWSRNDPLQSETIFRLSAHENKLGLRIARVDVFDKKIYLGMRNDQFALRELWVHDLLSGKCSKQKWDSSNYMFLSTPFLIDHEARIPYFTNFLPDGLGTIFTRRSVVSGEIVFKRDMKIDYIGASGAPSGGFSRGQPKQIDSFGTKLVGSQMESSF